MQVILSIAVIVTALSFITNSDTNRPQKITFIALGVTLVFLIRMIAEKIRVWTDKRFFRDAYDSEQILSELSEEVRSMVELRPLFEKVSTQISESLHVPQIVMLLKEGDSFRPAYALGYPQFPSVSLPENTKAVADLKKDDHLIVDEAVSPAEEDVAESGELKELNSRLLLAVGVKDDISGIISLSPKRSEEPYSPNDLRLLRSVASQTGLALHNSKLTESIAREAAQKERLNRELEIAREVQERLFPQELPAVAGLDYYGACRPALGVGGDYYDFIELADGNFGIAIGDVSGKGIGASLVMASLQASLRGQAIHSGNDLASLMKHVNKLVYEASTTDRYATFFYAQYDSRTRNLIYVNAGHNPPYVLRGGEILRLSDGGPVVGMLPPMIVQYEQGEIQLREGDILIGYTDGISEAMDPSDEEWGEDAMIDAVKAAADSVSKDILVKVVEKADEFAAGAKQHDDMTMIVVKVV
jgi:sigma-B regulation protein RsbU (phosphoserine phosphatase)